MREIILKDADSSVYTKWTILNGLDLISMKHKEADKADYHTRYIIQEKIREKTGETLEKREFFLETVKLRERLSGIMKDMNL